MSLRVALGAARRWGLPAPPTQQRQHRVVPGWRGPARRPAGCAPAAGPRGSPPAACRPARRRRRATTPAATSARAAASRSASTWLYQRGHRLRPRRSTAACTAAGQFVVTRRLPDDDRVLVAGDRAAPSRARRTAPARMAIPACCGCRNPPRCGSKASRATVMPQLTDRLDVAGGQAASVRGVVPPVAVASRAPHLAVPQQRADPVHRHLDRAELDGLRGRRWPGRS